MGKWSPKKIFTIIFSTVFSLFALGFVSGYQWHRQSVERDLKNLAWYQKNNLWKQGYSQAFGNYDLRSFDGGKNWYVVERDLGCDTLIIKGPAEEVSPGLLDHLKAWEELTKYAEEHGSITLAGDQSSMEKEAKLLEQAGFEVTAKTK